MLYLKTFGGLSIENGGRPIVGAASQRGRLALLAVLAGAGDTGISRDRLLALFWPESGDEQARGALRQALYALRRDTAEKDLIIGTTELRLNAATVSSDVREFELALKAGDLVTAVGHYRGRFLDGIYIKEAAEFDRWVEGERSRLAAAYVGALERLAQAADERGDLDEAVEWCRKLAATEPLSSRAACSLVRALVAAGRREAAFQHAQTFAALTRQELGVEPDPGVMSLAESLFTPAQPKPSATNPVRNNLPRRSPPATAAAKEPPAIPAPDIETRAPTAVPPKSRHRAFAFTVGISGLVALAAVAFALERPRGVAASSASETGMPAGEIRIRRAAMSAFVRANGSVSRDGRYFYAGTGDGARQLTRVDLRSGRVDTMGKVDGAINSVQVSPDGNRIAASAWISVLPTERAAFDGVSLWVAGIDGTPPRLLARPQYTADFQPIGWTPDSKQIVVLAQRDSAEGTSLNGDIYVALLSASDGKLRHVAEIGATWPGVMRLSPDGRYIAYTDREPVGTRTTIKAVDVATGRQTALVSPTGGEELLDWPSNRAILFTRSHGETRSVWLQTVDGDRPVGDARLVRADVPSIHPVGVTDNGELDYIVNPTGSEVVVVNLDSSSRSPSVPEPVDLRASDGTAGGVYSPDGRYLAYTARHSAGGVPGTASLVIQTLDGAEIREIPLTLRQPIVVNWTTDARHVLVRGEGLKQSEGRLVDVTTGTAVPSRFSEQAWVTLGRPEILSDGSLLRGVRDTSAASRWQEADNAVVRFDTATGRDAVLGRVSRMVRTVPSPDGTSFAAVLQDAGRQTLNLYSITPRGISFLRRLAPLSAPHTGRDATATIWSRDGKSIVVSIDQTVHDAAPKTAVMRFPLSGAPAEHLFDVQDRLILNSVHPNGRRFAFLKQTRPNSELWAMDIAPKR